MTERLRKYSYIGDKNLVPSEVFDNGQFTYFKFKADGLSRLPSVYTVDQNRNESLVNYHMQEDHMVIHGLAKQFTLRDGERVTSIFNDFAIGDWKKTI